MLNLNPEQFIIKPALATINCEPNWQWKRKAPIPNYDLIYIWSGKGNLRLNGKDYPLERGTCFLFRPGDWTTATHDPSNPLVITYIHFDVDGEPEIIPNHYRVLEDRIHFESLLSQYVRLFLIDTFGAEMEGKLILKQLMIHLIRNDQQTKIELQKDEDKGLQSQILYTIREVANYVQQHPGDNHTVESLAARANFSPRYFSKKFKEIMGQTIQSYIVETRIKRAEHLLHYTGMSVTEVADALGYNNIHFFSRQFKAYTGKSPSEIRMITGIRKPGIAQITSSRRKNA
ncbi:AraC family transcriptional regulator [Ureibacillus thermophilus]|uniref:AraC family transcriptional regulator n=1 Tax=Ureibacillus thermophilus TaxID=367743 RepID=UPI00360A5AF6